MAESEAFQEVPRVSESVSQGVSLGTTSRAEEYVEFLQGQLQQARDSERELRLLLARLEQTNAALSSALVQKALPPAPAVIVPTPTVETPTAKPVRWWMPWRRSG